MERCSIPRTLAPSVDPVSGMTPSVTASAHRDVDPAFDLQPATRIPPRFEQPPETLVVDRTTNFGVSRSVDRRAHCTPWRVDLRVSWTRDPARVAAPFLNVRDEVLRTRCRTRTTCAAWGR